MKGVDDVNEELCEDTCNFIGYIDRGSDEIIDYLSTAGGVSVDLSPFFGLIDSEYVIKAIDFVLTAKINKLVSNCGSCYMWHWIRKQMVETWMAYNLCDLAIYIIDQLKRRIEERQKG